MVVLPLSEFIIRVSAVVVPEILVKIMSLDADSAGLVQETLFGKVVVRSNRFSGIGVSGRCGKKLVIIVTAVYRVNSPLKRVLSAYRKDCARI